MKYINFNDLINNYTCGDENIKIEIISLDEYKLLHILRLPVNYLKITN